MGRRPCCSKVGLNKGVWTSAEDKILADYIQRHGEGGWRNLPKRAGLKRCGKSCRLRWMNYLRPDIKRGNISPDEEDLIIRLHKLLGNRWSLIAGRLPGRTDNEIKNYWNTTLRKRFGDNHTTFASSIPKKLTKRSNFKKKDKIKHRPTQTPAPKCTDDGVSNVLEPNLPSTFDVKVEPDQDKMYADLIPHENVRETVSASTREAILEPKNDNQVTQNLEPHSDRSEICLTELLSPDFSSLFGSDNHSHAENEIKSASPSSDERFVVEMLEELWSAENMIIEPNLGSPADLHLSSTSECIGDWLL